MTINDILFELQDPEYKKFHSRLMPTVSEENVIGIRIPTLRNLAKRIKDDEVSVSFLNDLPHRYYEENNLHVFLIEQIKDYKNCMEEVERFLPYIDNWATCDSLRPKCFGKNKEKLLVSVKTWIKSGHTYTVRFAIEMLMVYFLDEDFSLEYPEIVAAVESDEYYVKMMIAWYFATALAKQYESTVSFIEQYKLSPWVHNKTIQKAIESYRISDEKKKYLRTLKCRLD